MSDLATSRLGVFEGLDIDEYHGGPGLSNSGLNDLAQSPFHYYSRHLDPQRPAREVKDGQLEGHLAHCAILEPAEFSKRYTVTPADEPRRPSSSQWAAKNPSPESQAAMNWWRDFGSQHVGVTIIDSNLHATAMAQSVSVHNVSDVATLLREGAAEVSGYWRDPMTGVLCRCRPDFVSPVGGGVILLDVKTFSNASPRDFMLQVGRKHYERQAAWYSDGFQIAAKTEVLGFVFVAVETVWPYATGAYMLRDEWVEIGRRDNRRLLDLYAKCVHDNEWPSYGQGVEQLPIPSWLQNVDFYG